MFVLDRDNLGKFDTKANHVLASQSIGRCWCGQSYFVGADGIGRVLSSGGDTLTSWKVETASVASLVKEWDAAETPVSDVFQKGFFTSVSSDGVKTDSAIVWAVQRPATLPAILTLWAFDRERAKIAALPAGNWPNTGGAANTVPVVANGRVFVASNRELRIFGLGAPPAQVVASLTPMAKPAAGAAAVLTGTVVELDGSTLWLRTRTRMARVDVSEAERANKSVTLVPGRAVSVDGRLLSDGAVQAD